MEIYDTSMTASPTKAISWNFDELTYLSWNGHIESGNSLQNKGVTMYTYEDAVKQLQETGSIGLINFKELSYEDLDELLEEIKKWCVYANGDNKKLKKESKKNKKKDKKKK